MDKTATEYDWLLPGATLDPQTAARDPRPAVPQQIDGVLFRAYAPVQTSYGNLREVLRCEWLGDNAAVDQVFLSTLAPDAITAWHAHAVATDRLFVVAGQASLALYDNRPWSPTRGAVQVFALDGAAPGIVIVPPKVWHGLKNVGAKPLHMLNAVDIAYCYEAPDHWRVPPDSPAIPYRFA
jgi:dTDP-4-dehydrorhamnose 3,5-epimerase